MVKILANGEIVPDSDPRAKAAPVQRRPNTQSEPARASGATASSSSSSSRSSASQGASNGVPEEENVIIGDLARAVGVYGKTQKVMKRDVPLIYLIVGSILAFLWISGQTSVIKMLVFGFMLYVMYTQYQKSQAAGGGGFGFGGLGGDGSDSGSSGGSVINRGPPR
mmetsp:Transcript_54722/g.97611  ORF Transcript_54722/g.97611 Transcript_54722/m.97611 type:complete len:166 (+) Transcript_54722:78-575(+)